MKIILLADNNLTRAKGLMGHRPLGQDECAFFYFEKEGRPSFWNKNVSFPISLIFLDSSGKVDDIKKLGANQLNGVYPNSDKVRHVIEAHIEAPDIYGIKLGSKIDFDGEKIVVREE